MQIDTDDNKVLNINNQLKINSSSSPKQFKVQEKIERYHIPYTKIPTSVISSVTALAGHVFREARVAQAALPREPTHSHLAWTWKHWTRNHVVDALDVAVGPSAGGDDLCVPCVSAPCRRLDARPSPPPVSQPAGNSDHRGGIGSFDDRGTVLPPAFDNPGLRSGCQRASPLRRCWVSPARLGP